MPTTANMTLVLPTEGDSNDIWDTILNTAFGLIDEHDHTTGKGVKVPSAALNINADVSWASGGVNYAITDAKAVDFAAVAATSVSSLAGALFVNSSDANNLYFRTVSGTNVKITDGTTLNVSIVGGIGGDYSSIGALLDYDDATDTYRFRQQTSAAVRQYAKMANADIKLFEYIAAGGASVPTNAVTLKSPAALGAGYSVTFPAAVPASTNLVTMTSAGALAVDGILGSNQNLTLSGTGKVKQGNRSYMVPITVGNTISGFSSYNSAAPGVTVTDAGTATAWFALYGIDTTWRIQSVTVYSEASTNNTTYALVETTFAAGLPTAAFSADIAGTTTTTAVEPTILTPTTPFQMTLGHILWVRVSVPTGTDRHFHSAVVTYDIP